MKHVNCSIQGTATDTPFLVIDNGHRFDGVFESPSRVRFPIPESEPPWGATIFYGGQSIRYALTPDPEQEGPLLVYAMPSARVTVSGRDFLLNGSRWIYKGMTGFCDLKRFLDGEDIRPQLEQARELGANSRRVLGMMHHITRFYPSDYGGGYFYALTALASLYADYGLQLKFDCFADAQIITPDVGAQRAWWAQVCDTLRPIPNNLLALGNEWPKNGFNPSDFARPEGLTVSQGSALSDAPPPLPGWDFREWHGRRDWPKVHVSTEDMFYVSEGIENQDGHFVQAYPPAPAIHDEPMGFAEVDIPGRRSTDSLLARRLGYASLAHGNGSTFHSEDGIYSRLLGPIQQQCSRAMFGALG